MNNKEILQKNKGLKMTKTIGIYPNGDFKWNNVLSEHLEHHIEYQNCRPGRMFIVDGKIINDGMGVLENVSEERIQEIIKTVDEMQISYSTEPYV
jgi:hypothetical protein